MTLVPVSQRLGYRFPDGSIDVRGWRVISQDGKEVGEVHDLLVDDAGTPRYLDVDLGLFRKHVLLPIGQGFADRDEQVVRVPGLARDQFEAIPAYHHDLTRLTREYEAGLVAAYSSAYAEERYRPRPPYAGAVYGPSELETPVHPTGPPALAPLSRLHDFRIPEGEPDPRGWSVAAADGAVIGRVADLLVDTAALEVRYLLCAVEAPGAPARRVLVPTDAVRLDASRQTVRLKDLSPDQLALLPTYDDREAAGAPEEAAPGAPGFYEHPRFDAREFYGRRGQ